MSITLSSLPPPPGVKCYIYLLLCLTFHFCIQNVFLTHPFIHSFPHSFICSLHKHFWAPARFWKPYLVPEMVSWTGDFSWVCCVTTKARVLWEGRRDSPTSSGRLVKASWRRCWLMMSDVGGCVGTGQEKEQGTVVQNSRLQQAEKFRGQRRREGGAWWDCNLNRWLCWKNELAQPWSKSGRWFRRLLWESGPEAMEALE